MVTMDSTCDSSSSFDSSVSSDIGPRGRRDKASAFAFDLRLL